MVPLNTDDILNYLLQEKFPVQIQKETQQIYLINNIDNREFPLFIRIFTGGELLQIISFIPCNVKATAYGDLARLLHFLNKELDIPGFGLDENANLVFYRVMVPSVDKQIIGKHLTKYIRSIEQILKNFAQLIALVAFGAAKFEEIKKQIKPHEPSKKV